MICSKFFRFFFYPALGDLGVVKHQVVNGELNKDLQHLGQSKQSITLPGVTASNGLLDTVNVRFEVVLVANRAIQLHHAFCRV